MTEFKTLTDKELEKSELEYKYKYAFISDNKIIME